MKNQSQPTHGFMDLVEPFVDLDIQALRRRLFSETLLDQARLLVQEKAGNQEGLVNLLASLMADIHVLKAAYVEHSRYVEPNFNIAMPPKPDAVNRTSALIDLRGDITGGNWWPAEPFGRWAGPELESSLYFPSLETGDYDIVIHVASEIEPGTIDGMQVALDGEPLKLTRDGSGFELQGRVRIAEDRRLPFHVIKLKVERLRSPSEWGAEDKRMLSVGVQSVRLSKV